MEVILIDPLFVVINKPSGLLSVPGRGPSMQDCVVSRIKTLFPDGTVQPAVHRLDMDTSGLMVVARTSATHRNLSLQFAERMVDKRYIALLEGTVSQQAGEIALPFRLDPGNRPEDALVFPALLLRICPPNDDGQGLPQLQHHPRPDHLHLSPDSYQSDWTYHINSHSIKESPCKTSKKTRTSSG